MVKTIVNHPHNHHKWVVQNIPSHGWFMIVLTTLHDILCTLNQKPYLYIYIYNILYIPYVHIPHASGQAAQANWTPTDEPVTYEWGYAPSWLQAGSPFCSNAKLVRKAQWIATEQ